MNKPHVGVESMVMFLNLFQALRISQHPQGVFPRHCRPASRPVSAEKLAAFNIKELGKRIADCLNSECFPAFFKIMIEDVKYLHRVSP